MKLDIFAAPSPEYRPLSKWSATELRQELAALERDARKGYGDKAAKKKVLDELNRRTKES